MHTLLLVTLALAGDATSEEARSEAYDLLNEDDSFCGEGGRFGSPPCDWFVIGGRWSGLFQKTLFGRKYKAAFKREFPQFANDSYSDSLINQHRDQLNQFWHRFGGKDAHPITRGGYDHYGRADDAMPLNRHLYDHFLKNHAGRVTNLNDSGSLCDFADLDGDELNESFIDWKWLVVVDYHR